MKTMSAWDWMNLEAWLDELVEVGSITQDEADAHWSKREAEEQVPPMPHHAGCPCSACALDDPDARQREWERTGKKLPLLLI